MFRRRRPPRSSRHDIFTALESLEGRCLFSASHGFAPGFRGGPFASAIQSFLPRNSGNTIQFSQAPTAVQKGLSTLAEGAGLADPAATQAVYLGNSNGVETFTVRLSGTGTTSQFTVDSTGAAVVAPTNATTTFGAISNTSVTSEFTSIATALNLTAPSSTTSVKVSTPPTGPAIYTMQLSSSASGKSRNRIATISVDANGDLAGNENVPLSALSSAIQSGLTSNAPAGATALTASTLISVRTLNGVTTYSATYTSPGIRTTITVNAAGKLTSLPNTSTVQYSNVPKPAHDELQTLASADGVTDTLADTQNISVYDEGNGTTLYSVRLTATGTDSKGNTYSYPIVITVDQNGNPTVVPVSGDGGDFSGASGFPGGGFCP